MKKTPQILKLFLFSCDEQKNGRFKDAKLPITFHMENLNFLGIAK